MNALSQNGKRNFETAQAFGCLGIICFFSFECQDATIAKTGSAHHVRIGMSCPLRRYISYIHISNIFTRGFHSTTLIRPWSYWCLVGNGWDWGNGMIIDSYCGSFPHSLLSTSKNTWAMNKIPWLIGYELGTYTYTTLLGILRRQKVGKPWEETWKIEDLQ